LFIVLVALGAAHWTMVFGLPPHVPRDAADWPKELRYYALLQEATRTGVVPYYSSRPIQETRKFLAIPETVLSPQLLLLRWVSIDTFIFTNVLLLQAIATAGCLILQWRYRLSLAATVMAWLLLGFNGHITAHFAIGHSMWGGYFFLPFFFGLVLALVEGAVDRRWSMAVGLVLAVMLLQGSYHIFVWCVLALLLLLVFQPQRRAVALALAWSAALGLCRLVPAAIILLGRRDREFQTGYGSAGDFLAALVVVRDVTFPRRGSGSMGGLNWWEFDLYVGVMAAAWLLVFGTRRLLRPEYRVRLAVPVAIVAVLSLGSIYAPLNQLGVPLLAAERVSSRLLVMVVGFLAVAAAVESDRWAQRRLRRWVLWTVALVTAASLGIHSQTWSLARIAALSPPPAHERELEIHLVPPSEDEPRNAAYVSSVRLSALASAAAFAALVWRWRRRPAT
jgi:hypothetical protein